MKNVTINTKSFDTRKSIKKAIHNKSKSLTWEINADGITCKWSTKLERVSVIRNGVPYEIIETLSERLNLPIKSVLSILGIPQTTYNKKKSSHSLLDSHDSELVVLITELIDYGLIVFNQEKEKFQRWLKKPNLALGGSTPESFLDTSTGINEVNFCLNRIEFGNFA